MSCYSTWTVGSETGSGFLCILLYNGASKLTEKSMNEQKITFGAMQTNPLLIVISGQSGIGKDAVVGLLRKTNTDTHFVITMNSRPPRPDEVEGKDYYLVTSEEIEEKIANAELIENARV